MTLRDFDPGVIGNYPERKYLLHFQWNDGTEKICRYALVETFNSSEIHSKTKQKSTTRVFVVFLDLQTKQSKTHNMFL